MTRDGFVGTYCDIRRTRVLGCSGEPRPARQPREVERRAKGGLPHTPLFHTAGPSNSRPQVRMYSVFSTTKNIMVSSPPDLPDEHSVLHARVTILLPGRASTRLMHVGLN